MSFLHVLQYKKMSMAKVSEDLQVENEDGTKWSCYVTFIEVANFGVFLNPYWGKSFVKCSSGFM